MRLRIRHPPDNPILDIPDDKTFGYLRDQISNLLNLPPHSFTIKFGFPPLEVLAGDSASLAETALRDGDLITLQQQQQLAPTTGSTGRSGSLPGAAAADQAVAKKRPAASGQKRRVTSRGDLVWASAIDDSLDSLSSLNEPPAKKLRSFSSDAASVEEEWGANLVEVFSKSGGTAAERLLKGAFRSAVSRRYEAALAEQRCAAVAAGCYSVCEPAVGSVKFKVTFPIGRSTKTEQYVAFPSQLLSSVIKEVYNSGADTSATGGDARNNLRPIYLAEVQPSIFWNIVRLFNGQIKEGLKSLCPEFDWDFIDSRQRTLSEKAKLSKEQEEHKPARQRSVAARKSAGNEEEGLKHGVT